MGQILLPKEYNPGWGTPRVKPPGPLTIDWSNPLTHGLYEAWLIDGYQRPGLVQGLPFTLEGGVTSTGYTITPYSVTHDGSASHALQFGTLPVASWNGLTAVVVCSDLNPGAANRRLLSIQHSGGDDYRLFIPSAAAPLNMRIDWDDGTFTAKTFTVASHAGIPHTYAMANTGSEALAYYDGLEVVSRYSESTSLSGAGGLTEIADYTGGSSALAGTYYAFFVFKEALTEGQLASITLDPYQILKPANDLSIFIAGGTDTNVNATTDALIITEQSATVNAETNVNAGTDALVITEQAADVNLDKFVSATTQALTITEQSATVNAETNVQASLDTLVITEQSATVNAERNVQANTATLTISEQGADVNLNKSVSAGFDTLVITEQNATITTGNDTNVAAGVVSLTITEQTASVNAETNVNANVDALTITGQQADVNLDLTVNATTASLTLTEATADVNLDRLVAANTATLTLSEQAATVTATQAADIKIDGANTHVLSTNYQSATLYYNGSNYFTID